VARSGRTWAGAILLAVVVLVVGDGAQAKPASVSYQSHAALTITPNGGGYEGQGQTVVVTITSPQAACRSRRFKLDYRDPTGYLAETHTYRTNAAGSWRLDIVALPGPGRVIVTVPPKRLDGTHRCQATGDVVPI
jgi:hypothetical protein